VLVFDSGSWTPQTPQVWSLGGNPGTTPGTNYLGTSDNQPLELHVNGMRALRFEPTANDAGHSNIVNVIGGSPANYVSNSVVGATIAGGGAANYIGYLSSSNSVAADFGTVGGGYQNSITAYEATIGGGVRNTATNRDATIGGGFFNTAGGIAATVGGGEENTAGADVATVSGGIENIASGIDGTVGGGQQNTASGGFATVPGGFFNTASGDYSFAAGDEAKALNRGAFVWADSQVAPFSSTANDQFSVRAQGGVRLVTGGTGLTVDGQPALAGANGGGLTNVNASLLQGLDSTSFWKTSGNGGTTPGVNFIGTSDNQPLELHVNGLRVLRLEPTANIANYSNIVNVIGGSPVNYVSNGVRGATIAGGGAANYFGSSSNSVTADFGTVGGGYQNSITALALVATIGGGAKNTVTNFNSTIAGGFANIAGGPGATVGGGQLNTATGNFSTVSGGFTNIASIDFDTVSGGRGNHAIGGSSTVPGGDQNIASGGYSFAAGRQAQALNEGAFVWADSQFGAFSSTANDQFLIRAQGGVGIGITNPLSPLDVGGRIRSRGDTAFNTAGIWLQRADTASDRAFVGMFGDGYVGFFGNAGASWGLVMNVTNGNVGIGATSPAHLLQVGVGGSPAYCDGGNWVNGSDRNAKRAFTAINARDVLEKVSDLPITEWQYKTDAEGMRHLGPMAQDFHAAFGLNGEDEKHISTVDEGGVALAAIQGLNQKLEEARVENAELKARVEKLEELLNRRLER
jgi:hypothetical protein